MTPTADGEPQPEQAKARPAADGREAVVSALRPLGLGFLQPTDTVARPMASGDLIARLAASPDARLRNVLAVLFVRQPSLAAAVPDALDGLAEPEARELRTQYTAGLYLQRMWRTRLRLLRPGLPDLPDLFSRELGLPSPDERHGMTGLYALAARSRYNVLASYEALMAQLFYQMEREAVEPAPSR